MNIAGTGSDRAWAPTAIVLAAVSALALVPVTVTPSSVEVSGIAEIVRFKNEYCWDRFRSGVGAHRNRARRRVGIGVGAGDRDAIERRGLRDRGDRQIQK